ncbi:hypothetical protein HanXRQr2_Chr11g0499761 [Helianthus annuus]|uniref:Uncharacterized protein n=1 Tax=Helianthus annuus TaxID=4232 RepID=A0A9K3N0R8_HELAN|nr:hypothetical protein HanXRQr2_Chr11g0499761 [Helianthus annuus]KAJ0875855.1 hypothetical protein HanPSC8_Chr11g0481481 [Helianthus annuus]
MSHLIGILEFSFHLLHLFPFQAMILTLSSVIFLVTSCEFRRKPNDSSKYFVSSPYNELYQILSTQNFMLFY